jgi:transcriptional regulator with XRE-family HTH domain
MDEIGDRLRTERERLGLSQTEFAAMGGVNRNAQGNYELGKRQPDALYLSLVAAHGVDVQFVVTGIAAAPIKGDEADLLRRYRAASPELRAAVFGVLGASTASPSTPAPAVAISGGDQGQVVAGNAHQDGLTINVGRKKRGPGK